MRTSISIFAHLILLFVVTNAIASPVFDYDKKLAIDLATAYVRHELRGNRNPDIGEVNFRKPFIKAATDSRGRNFVFVAFPSSTSSWGAYATFQVCQSTPLLVPNDVGTVDTFEAYRSAQNEVSPKIYVALPDMCPKDEE